MGNQQQTFSYKLTTKYDFISYQKDPIIGPIKIYRKCQPFYNYLMVVDRWIDHGHVSKHTQQLKAIDDRQKGEIESMMLKVFAKEVIQDSFKNNCSKKIQYRLYVEYLNYSLKNLIQHRNQQYAKFTIDQVTYVVNSILEMYRFFTSIDATQCSFNSQEIFLIPEGEVRFNPLQIFPKQTSQQIDCVQANCKPVKFKKIFRIQDKLILYEIKKIVTEMTEQCDPRIAEDSKLFGLKKNVGACNNVKELEELVCKSPIERLEFNPKKTFLSEQDTTKGLSVSNSSKISVKYVKR